ncbi:hypothetical protein [Nocardioides sp. NPDC047086]
MTMNENPTTTDAIDDLSWDDWSDAAVCAIENGPDCEACEG